MCPAIGLPRMLHGDGSGRVPFSLVAVLLLLSVGLSAALVAKVERDDATQRAHEARLFALSRVAELVHEEVEAQAQQIAVRAIAAGTDGVLNESRIEGAFDVGFAEYVQSHFPRVARGVRIEVSAYEASVYLMDRQVDDAVISNATRTTPIGGEAMSFVDANAPDDWAPIDAVAYHAVLGSVNYTLSMGSVTVDRQVPLNAVAPAPVPLMAAKLEQATHAGLGDFAGVGQTVKAILANVVQFRVLSGWASPAKPGTTTRDVLTTEDVELAVNLAFLLEQVRIFRTFDREAAQSADDARGALPPIPEGQPLRAAERSLQHLLDTYAADGTLDVADLYAVYTGLDASGISMAAVLAQAIAGIADQLLLKQLDYLGLMPLADFFVQANAWASDVVDGFLRWLFDKPSRQVEYVWEYLKVALEDTGVGTQFLGPTSSAIPDRTYAIGGVNLTVAAHSTVVPFPTKELRSRDYDEFWETYFPRFNASVTLVGRSIREMVNEFATQVGHSAILAGLLPESASGPIDPKDDTSFLEALGSRVLRAVDDALRWILTDPTAIETLMSNLWESVRATLRDLIEHVIASYDYLAGRDEVIPPAHSAIVNEVYARASQDPDFSQLDPAGRDALRSAIDSDASSSGWATDAYAGRKTQDSSRWRQGVDTANGESVRLQLLQAVVGDAGLMALARTMIEGLFREAEAAHDVAGLRVVTRTRLDPFVLSGGSDADGARAERFRVRQDPPYLRGSGGIPPEGPRPGDLMIEVQDPAALPADYGTPNVHFTKPTELTRRPYTTTWSVRVLGAVRLRVETEAGVVPGTGGLRPIVLDDVWRLNFTLSIPAYSGWGLAGVAYRNSNSFADDLFDFIVRFLDAAWDFLEPLLRPFLDAIRQVARAFLQLVEPLLRFGRQVIEFLARVTSGLLDFVRSLVTGLVDVLMTVLDFFLSLNDSPQSFVIDGHGIRVAFFVNGPEGRRLTLGVQMGGLGVGVQIVDLVKAGLAVAGGPRWDLVVDWGAAVDPFRMSARLDPAMAFETHMAQAHASWAGSWAMDAVGPSEERRFFAGQAWAVSDVPTPIGTADVELGVRVLFPAVPEAVVSVLEQSYAQTVEQLGGTPRSLEGMGHFLRAFAENLVDAALQTFDNEVALQVYLRLQLKEAMSAGAGFVLSFAIEGRAIREFLSWLGRNALAFLRSGLNPLAPADYEGLPPGVPEHMWIGATGFLVLETPRALTSFAQGLGLHVRLAATVSANVAAIGALTGRVWGAWSVEFGALLEVGLDGVPVGFFSTGWLLEIWLMRGSVHAA